MSNQVGEDAQFLLNGLFDSTLPMITKDFNSYPDHRINFFIFLKFAVKNCFQYLIKIKPVQFKILIDCLLWSIKHELSTIFVIGLKTIQILLEVLFFSNFFRGSVNLNKWPMGSLNVIISLSCMKLLLC